jgi:hypothetical protein
VCVCPDFDISGENRETKAKRERNDERRKKKMKNKLAELGT